MAVDIMPIPANLITTFRDRGEPWTLRALILGARVKLGLAASLRNCIMMVSCNARPLSTGDKCALRVSRDEAVDATETTDIWRDLPPLSRVGVSNVDTVDWVVNRR